jgi:hypothetical protein
MAQPLFLVVISLFCALMSSLAQATTLPGALAYVDEVHVACVVDQSTVHSTPLEAATLCGYARSALIELSSGNLNDKVAWADFLKPHALEECRKQSIGLADECNPNDYTIYKGREFSVSVIEFQKREEPSQNAVTAVVSAALEGDERRMSAFLSIDILMPQNQGAPERATFHIPVDKISEYSNVDAQSLKYTLKYLFSIYFTPQVINLITENREYKKRTR